MAVALNDWRDYVRFRDDIGELLDTRFYTLGWLDEQVLTGVARVWATETACILATINTFPAGGKEVHGMVAVGDLSSIRMLIPHAEQWGVKRGCVVASISSREGWGKALESAGYELFQATIRKELPLDACNAFGYQNTMRGDS